MRDFSSLSFPKRGKEIIDRAKAMHKENAAKADEKKKEAEKLCTEYKIDVLKLLTEEDGLRGYSNAVLPSQEMSKLSTLARRIHDLQQENKQLELIVGNLPENNEFNLTFDELKYFGF